jgi:hypothetical protein
MGFLQALTAFASACCDSIAGHGNDRLLRQHFTLRTIRAAKKLKKKRDNRWAAPVISDPRQKTQKENSQ